ncbi:lipid-A-disaccharide synthase N-terminal domain-containing protein [Paracoccus sp. (in: a-proteobacteria)]|uniref:lipid-A-disaccharide synthase N-terminal domain-containing protein n=1 Tax=Paracoccus sp. TaxID=267 RepID=UPI003A844C40
MNEFASWLKSFTNVDGMWLLIGLLAQAMFSARFLVQWIASERVRKSIVPNAFWYFSMAGGAMLFAYAIHRRDLVFMLGQGFGLIVYSRNIFFLRNAPKE